MRKLLVRLALLGAAAVTAVAVRNYLRDPVGAKRGDVQIVLDNGTTTVEPEPVEAQEFADIARKVLETTGGR